MGTPLRIAVHGGASSANTIPPDIEKRAKEVLAIALRAGFAILSRGGSAVEAVSAAVVVLEDDEVFNAGKGAVFTKQGKHELDASIMNGKTLDCGAVAGLTHIKNPIVLARAVMEHSKHVLMIAEGAEAFARKHHLAFVDNTYFSTDRRYKEWQIAKSNNQMGLEGCDGKGCDGKGGDEQEDLSEHGTVGAVALDAEGNLAAATSTGGLTNKLAGRVGDSPLIGAGTYANNRTCAVSCTGHGEFFIRHAVAHDMHALMKYKGLSLQEAADTVIHKHLKDNNGDGGLIAVDCLGNVCLPFNTRIMYRGWMEAESKLFTFVK